MTSTEFRRWRCPGCQREFRVPQNRPDPTLCNDCQKNATKAKGPPLPPPTPRPPASEEPKSDELGIGGFQVDEPAFVTIRRFVERPENGRKSSKWNWAVPLPVIGMLNPLELVLNISRVFGIINCILGAAFMVLGPIVVILGTVTGYFGSTPLERESMLIGVISNLVFPIIAGLVTMFVGILQLANYEVMARFSLMEDHLNAIRKHLSNQAARSGS